MLNKERLIDEFIELVSVPCPSKGEKEVAELIMSKLRAMGIEPEMDKAHEKLAVTAVMCGRILKATFLLLPYFSSRLIWIALLPPLAPK